MPDYIDYQRNNPFRPPDWCWQRAQLKVNGDAPGPSIKRDGQGYEWISKGITFYRRLLSASNPTQHLALSDKYPDIYWAHRLHTNLDNPAKQAVEAKIMARETPDQIAMQIGCGRKMIMAYEGLFFDVRDKLDNDLYVSQVILGRPLQNDLSEKNFGLLWKLFGLKTGPKVLDALMTKMVNPAWANQQDEVSATLQEVAINAIKLKAAMAAVMVPVNAGTFELLLSSFVKYFEVERTTDSAGRTRDQTLVHVDAMFQNLPFQVGNDPQDPSKDSPIVQQFDRIGIELSYHETMLAEVGVPVRNARLLESMRFPEPTNGTTQQGSGATAPDGGGGDG